MRVTDFNALDMVTVQLIGISNTLYNVWKQNLLMAIEDMEEMIVLEEVNDLQRIIDFGIRSIPAFALEKEVLLDQVKEVPNKEEFKLMIETRLLKIKNTMKKIIVPIDFSENANNAFCYASQLATEFDSKLSLVHVCHPGTDTINNLAIPTMDELVAYNKERLEKFVETGHSSDGGTSLIAQKIEQEPIVGFVNEELIKLSKQEDTDAIVMGTRGEGGVFERVFGSVSSHVSQKANCPVWLIPPEAKFQGLKKIAYASNFESSDSQVFSKILDLSFLFESELYFVHVSENKEEVPLDSLALETQFKEKVPFFDVNVDVLEGDAPWKALNAYITEKDIDLLVLVTRKRTFWENIIHKSQTKEMVLHAKVPLLVMHVEDQA